MVRSLASHQCGPGSTPGAVDAICGLSLLLVLSLASRGFSPGTLLFPSSQKLTLSNSNSIWKRTDMFKQVHMNSSVLRGYVIKQPIYNFFLILFFLY